ncbi:MAG: hypothetical protein M1821_006387 [Bathelium mastoideum]|nr:MAG: hypothetical protein M1821_006387 [Bathelium mastoideum]
MQSIHGRSKSIEDTEKATKNYLLTNEGEEKAYRVAYAVHQFLVNHASDAMGSSQQALEQENKPTEFIGLVTLASLAPGQLALPEHFTIPATAAANTLTVELAYSFLPKAWGKGYATESVGAVLESCKKAQAFWVPFSKVYVRVIVNAANLPSQRVMDKTGMVKRGVYELTTEPIWLAGEWQRDHSLHIFGMHLLA